MQEDGKREPTPSRQVRRDPRVLVCARALLETKGGRPTEHLVHDLSASGVRLCGLPRASVGDRVDLLLELPTAWVPAVARLVRVSAGARPDFALQLESLDAGGEAAIRQAVHDALGRRDRRSVLLLRDPRDPQWSGWDWLAPVLPICAAASTPLEAVRCLEQYDISVALLGEPSASQLEAWRRALPELTWRTIDRAGRLWCADAPRGLE